MLILRQPNSIVDRIFQTERAGLSISCLVEPSTMVHTDSDDGKSQRHIDPGNRFPLLGSLIVHKVFYL